MFSFPSNITEGIVLWQILAVVTVYLLYKWSTSTFDYWKKKKVRIPYRPLPLVGHLGRVINNDLNIGYLLKEMCDHNMEERYFGFYMTRKPVLILNDAELVVHVMIKDFRLFNDKGFDPDTDVDMIMNNLFFLTGQRWKFQRSKFSPAFTSGKLKSMYSQIHHCSVSFVNHLTKLSQQNDRLEVNLKSSIEDLFTDIVCKCILGLEMHSIEHPDEEYKEIQCATLKPNWRLHTKQVLQFLCPWIDRKIRISGKRIENWFFEFAKKNVHMRKEQNIQRNDLLQTLINVYSEYHQIDVNSEEYFGLRQLAANIFVFIVAGFETSALTTTFFLHKMALHPDIQERLRREILDVKESKENHGPLDYEDFKKMPYLRMVLNEILRMYPVLPLYSRRTLVPYKIPGSDLTLDPGPFVITPTVALHYSPKYWTDPHVFDPERFSEENLSSIVPGSFIPFNEGPRQCIGKRFAYLQMNSAICEILTHFEIQSTPRTVEHTDFVVGAMVMVPKEKLLADFVPKKFI